MATQHILMVSWPAIGHARPMLDFAASLLSDYTNIVLTFICSDDQIASLRKIDSRTADPRLKLVGLKVDYKPPTPGGGSEIEPEVVLTMQAAHHLSAHFAEVYAGLEVTPSLVICNWMIQRVAEVVRTKTPETKLMAFFDNAATFVTRMLGPVEIGGYGGVQKLWEKYCDDHPEASRDDLQLKEKLFGRRSEGTFQIPGSGMDLMNDKEMSPQAKSYLLKVPLTPSLVEIQKLVDLSDAILINTHESVEGNILAYLRSVIDKDIYAIGSVMFRQLVELGKTVRTRTALDVASQSSGIDRSEGDVMQFLDSQPRGTVLYISFGTMFRPTPSQLVKMLEILVQEAPDLSFIWTLGSGKDLISSSPPEEQQKVRDLQSKLLTSGRGRLVDWADQHAILQHPSTGFFLSHGGWNSCQESILAGKPLLVFPFFGDQLFDAYLLKSRKIAYHIQSSRFDSPEAFLSSYRYALQLCHTGNEDGEKLKRNSEKLLENILQERAEVERSNEKRTKAEWRDLFAGEARADSRVGKMAVKV